jgi:hypothetical protein
LLKQELQLIAATAVVEAVCTSCTFVTARCLLSMLVCLRLCRIIKSMYHKLSFLRNPRYPMPAATAAMLAQGMRGGSSLRMQQQQQTTSGSRSKIRSRSPARSGRSPVPHASATAAAAGCIVAEDAGFCVLPAAGVLFDAYEPGGVYFQTVQVQNVGGVMRGLRLLPPASRYFQVSLPR